MKFRRLLSLFCTALFVIAMLPTVAQAKQNTSVTVNDWYNDWGAVKCLDITFNADITSATSGSIAGKLAEYIEVNGVSIKKRMDRPKDYNVGDCSGFNGLSADIGATENSKRILIYLAGGGTGDLAQDVNNTLVLRKGMPLKTGTLERDIIMKMSSDGKWVENADEDIRPTAAVKEWFYDWNPVYCIDVTFSHHVTQLTEGSLASSLAKYIEVNGVNLKKRMEKDPSLGIGDCSGFDGLAADVGATATGNNILIYLCGGGKGSISANTANTITFLRGMPFLNGTLAEDFSMVMDPISGVWTRASGALPIESFVSICIVAPAGGGVTEWPDYNAVDVYFNTPVFDTDILPPATVLGKKWTDQITINGIVLTDRVKNDPKLEIKESFSALGAPAAVTVINRYGMRIYYCGGGKGNLDPGIANTIVFSEQFPILSRVMGRKALMIMNTTTKGWAEEGSNYQEIDDLAIGYNPERDWTSGTRFSMWGAYYNNTSTSTRYGGAQCDLIFNNCTRILWYGVKNAERGSADVYIDGVFSEYVSCADPDYIPSGVMYDSGVLPEGTHSIRIVTRDSGGLWVETDKIVGVGKAKDGYTVNNTNHNFFKYSPFWTYDGNCPEMLGQDCFYTDDSRAYTEMLFMGRYITLYGASGPDMGQVKIYLDGEDKGIVDCYSATAEFKKVLFAVDGLTGEGYHRLRIEVLPDRNPASTGGKVIIDAADIDNFYPYTLYMQDAAAAEIAVIEKGEKAYLDPKEWNPVFNVAQAPQTGVNLKSGMIADAFTKNVDYIKRCAGLANYVDMSTAWDVLAASNEGRMLAGAAGALRWIKSDVLEKVVDDILAGIEARVKSNGWLMPYDETSYETQGGLADEMKNYDRAMFTNGMLAAGAIGKTKAYDLLRDFYDWFYSSDYAKGMLKGSLGIQGSITGPNLYFTPVGTEQDLINNMKYYDMDWFINALAEGQSDAVYKYPFDRPHSYMITAVNSYIDEYRATGDQKYLKAAFGIWDIIRNGYINIGGGIALCEYQTYAPHSLYISTGDGYTPYELCGNCLWIDYCHKMMLLYPDEEKYSGEIERSIYNIMCGAQTQNGNLTYHQFFNGRKEGAAVYNTCCENQAARVMSLLPQYVYSIADDGGLYINLFADSDISWKHNDAELSATVTTLYPYDGKVTITINKTNGNTSKMHIRVPEWIIHPYDITVNGKRECSAEAGTFAVIERKWQTGDKIEFTVPMSMRVTEYTGITQVAGEKRYGIEYGPVLMALVGNMGTEFEQYPGDYVKKLGFTPEALLGAVHITDKENLTFSIDGYSDYKLIPYADVESETFTSYPILQAGSSVNAMISDEAGSVPTPTPGSTVPADSPSSEPTLPSQPENGISAGTVAAIAGGAVLVAGAVTAGIVIGKKKRKK